MKFTLKDYQADAVSALLERLESARSQFRSFDERSSVSLCATTGAGKTVMSAAVIEALFNGSDEFEFEQDETAVVIWFSDSPELNAQTKQRLMDASDKLVRSDLVTIEPPFAQPRLEAGKVYFLNTQKLGAKSKLTRGAPAEDLQDAMVDSLQPDDQAWTIWETINNTIADPNLTLYLFLDEAHRGFGAKTTRDKSTIVKRLVNGSNLVQPAPIVVGISATIGKFATAMSDADFQSNRKALEPVNVDGERVQESGLLKDTVVVDFTTENGVFDRALVRKGAERLRNATEAWREYARVQQDPSTHVVPLLVLQIPNRPDHDEVGRALDVIREVMPNIIDSNVRHVLGEHSDQEFGSWRVGWIPAQDVQEKTEIRVLIAKEAISTGWDCPRAEVMVSFRTAKEKDHITQILGRMVRNPLARRVPGDERLNSVNCLLPHFDRTTAGKVVRELTGTAKDVPGSGKEVLLDAREMSVNPHIEDAEAVWDAWRALPTQTLPQRGVKPVSRLLQFATELETDGIRPGAVAEAEEECLIALEAFGKLNRKEIELSRREVETIRGMSISGTTGEERLSYEEFALEADDQAVAIAYKNAVAVFSDVARAFVNRETAREEDDFANPEREAMIRISALATAPHVRASVEHRANSIFGDWDWEHGDAIELLSDLRRERYRDIKAQDPEPQDASMVTPRNRMESYLELDRNDAPVAAPLAPKHLMSDEDGNYPLGKLNLWERRLILDEVSRADLVAWYRNPPRSAGDSLCVAYRNEIGNWRGLYPDFILFERVDGLIKPSIVDPHRFDLDDAVSKLRALTTFAQQHGDKFHRIESTIELGSKRWTLDLKSPTVQEHVLRWNETRSLDNLYTSRGTPSRPDLPAPAHSGGTVSADQSSLIEGM
ncbi:type III restriction/modification enzyme restriction subunit [Luteococcus japonicus]|uniref:Type III restriction/modification enzyme restriction subunit n=1 Tax=Luteococcus japonicus TaxID=33984 RepID=A0A3N1ZW65_9ACTN|nr:DEAD/DEAH box helicase family protein [Luteococcus japonicus]ROR55065.1 type III restriction/modification enzyme restriction subunit [Luteococcus japonicus]